MLEEYFVKPHTVDRIRASWIGPEIERYVAWLAGQGYSARSVLRRVPLLAAFGEFARLNGAQSVADLPGHVDGFVGKRVGESRDARREMGQTLAKDIRGPVEQLLELVVPGFEPTGRPHHAIPFAGAVPGFFEYLTSERGLRPASVLSYRHHLDRFEAYLERLGVTGLGELSPALLSAFVAERSGPAWPRPRCGRAAACCGCSCATHTAKGSSAAICGRRWNGRRPTGSPPSPGRSPGTTSARCSPPPIAARRAGNATTRSCSSSRPTAFAAARSRRSPWTTSTGSASAWPSPNARPGTRPPSRCRARPARRSPTTSSTAGRRAPTGTSSSGRWRRCSRLGTDAVSSCARRYLLKAGIQVPRPGSHTLRHSAVQRLVDADFSLKTIGDFVGHRSAASTEIYAKVAVESLRQVALGDGEEVLG